MAGYMEEYGRAEQQHARRIRLVRIAAVTVGAVLLLGTILYAVFKNYPEEKRVKAFVELLGRHDYAGAYRLWGCTEQQPCRDYSFQRFEQDWGPQSPHADISDARIGTSQSCGTGVVVQVDFKSSEPVPLWVERGSKNIGFAPWPECPGRHLRLGAWLRSLFGK